MTRMSTTQPASSPDRDLDVDVTELLEALADEVKKDLDEDIEVIDSGTEFPSKVYTDVPKWVRINDVVAVFGDLRNSTGLSVNHYAKSTAHIYEAATGGMVQAFSAFVPDFIDIQGDGVFGIFAGARRYERAMCAAITLRTFSEHVLVPQLHGRLPQKPPQTGIKIGVAAGHVLVKKIGVRGANEPVWAGRPVNFAAKCAQAAEEHEVIITGKVYEKIKSNEYLSWTCGCPTGASYSKIWHAKTVSTLPADTGTAYRMNARGWCDEHGAEFCTAILDGDTSRGLGYAA